MQVDFYYLTRDPAEKLVPVLADKCLNAQARLLLLSADISQCASLSEALWAHDPTSFLAHDMAGSARETEQPILLSDQPTAANGARYALVADGIWRDELLSFERIFYLFTAMEVDIARAAWRQLSANEMVSPRYWKQDGGRWIEGP